MSSGNIVTFETMLIGYTDAAARFDDAAKERDPQLAFTAAFEALNWAVALDERIAKHWCPDGDPLEWRWRDRVGHGAHLMRGVRFVRNRLHHDWAEALDVDERGRSYPKTYPVRYFEWIWRPADELPPPHRSEFQGNEEVYRNEMERRPVRIVLNVLNGAFYWLQQLLEPQTISKTWYGGRPAVPGGRAAWGFPVTVTGALLGRPASECVSRRSLRSSEEVPRTIATATSESPGSAPVSAATDDRIRPT
jgi:hypothetical protein